MIWESTPIAVWCGGCGARLAAGTMVARVTKAYKIRCSACIEGWRKPPAPRVEALGDDLPLDAPPIREPGEDDDP